MIEIVIFSELDTFIYTRIHGKNVTVSVSIGRMFTWRLQCIVAASLKSVICHRCKMYHNPCNIDVSTDNPSIRLRHGYPYEYKHVSSLSSNKSQNLSKSALRNNVIKSTSKETLFDLFDPLQKLNYLQHKRTVSDKC